MRGVGPTDGDPDRPVVTDKDSDYDKADGTNVFASLQSTKTKLDELFANHR